MSENPFVVIEWDDAYSETTSWISLSDIGEEPCGTISVGILLPDAKPDHVVIAQSMNNLSAEETERSYDSVLCIPVGMVRSMRLVSVQGATPLFPRTSSG